MAIENGPFEDVWILLKMAIFQPAMLVYRRVNIITNSSGPHTPKLPTPRTPQEI